MKYVSALVFTFQFLHILTPRITDSNIYTLSPSYIASDLSSDFSTSDLTQIQFSAEFPSDISNIPSFQHTLHPSSHLTQIQFSAEAREAAEAAAAAAEEAQAAGQQS